MMNYHQSEIEALLKEVQDGHDLHRYNTRDPAAPLPYTRPGFPPYLNPTATQRNPSTARLQSQGYTNRQPLYESQDPQTSTALTAPRVLYDRETQETHTRGALYALEKAYCANRVFSSFFTSSATSDESR